MHLVHKDRETLPSVKICPQCGTQLHEMYPDELCPLCIERNLFSDVKDYIRNNDVNEQDVSEHFNIPVAKVRGWIKEGRIQYKGESKDSISGVNCRFCGKSIAFGTTCADCRRLEDLQIIASMKKSENGHMRFVGQS